MYYEYVNKMIKMVNVMKTELINTNSIPSTHSSRNSKLDPVNEYSTHP